MLRTSVGQLLVNEALPEDMRDYARVLDKKSVGELLNALATRHPDKYVEVSKKLNDVGRTAATESGGYTFGLEHLRTAAAAKKYRDEIDRRLKHILDRDDLTPQQRNAMIVKAAGALQQRQIDEVYDEAVRGGNPLAMQVVSGSRGNKMNLASLLASDLLYSDHRDETIPLPVLSSYSQGLRPIEYWAATYGARRGTIATKFATADAGFLSKQLNQIAHRLLVVGDDDDREGLPHRGLPVDTDDADNEGALLAQDVGPYKRNTVLTPKILRHIKGLGHDRVLVRSPLVGGSPDGGVYARDVGVRERGTLPGRGEMVGLTAAQALSEPLSQGQLSAKHSGGVAGQEKAVGGFQYVNQLIQVPQKFKGGATHAEADGRVTMVEPAPAGGSYVWIGGKRHYVPAGVPMTVKRGDEVEAGDTISEGFPHPAVVVRHKGIGEGKRYFVNAFRRAMKDSGMKVNRRNVELLARGLINHVRLTDEFGDYVPDDVVPYSTLEHLYVPRPDHQTLRVGPGLVGHYLERPVLHYSVGTKVRPSVLKELQHFGVAEVAAHKDPPPFEPEMIRGMYSLRYDPDPVTRMYGSGLKDSLLDSVHRGRVSDELGTSFVPGLARAVEFGRVGAVRASEPGVKPPPEGQPLGDPRRSPPPPTPPAERKKPGGLLAGLFGKSAEALRAEAVAILKAAADPTKPTVTSTVRPETGSSTAAPATTTAVTAQGDRAGPHPAGPTPPTPAAPQAGPARAPLGPADFRHAQPPPAATPAPAGRPHPARLPGALMSPQDSPEALAAFVTGGGESHADGFGGELGAVTRFGSLLGGDATAALTGGPNFRPPPDTTSPRDDLIGGGGVPYAAWGDIGVDASPATARAGPPPAAADPAAPPAQGPPAYASAAQYGWAPGRKEFDDARAALASARGVAPAAVGEADVRADMFDAVRAGLSAARAGYSPGKPAFEALRGTLAAEARAGAADQPQTPVSDADVHAAARARGLYDPKAVGEYATHEELAQAGRGPGEQVGRLLVNPGGNAAAVAGLSLAYRGARGAVGAPAAGGLLGGVAKPVGRLLPGVGVGVEAIDGLTQSRDEGLARLDAKTRGDLDASVPLLGRVRGDTVGGYLLENAMNPGRNAAAIVSGWRDRNQRLEEAAATGAAADANAAAAAKVTVARLEETQKLRPLTPEEAEALTRNKARVPATPQAAAAADKRWLRAYARDDAQQADTARESLDKVFGRPPGEVDPALAAAARRYVEGLTADYPAFLPDPKPEDTAATAAELARVRGIVARGGDQALLAALDRKIAEVAGRAGRQATPAWMRHLPTTPAAAPAARPEQPRTVPPGVLFRDRGPAFGQD